MPLNHQHANSVSQTTLKETNEMFYTTNFKFELEIYYVGGIRYEGTCELLHPMYCLVASF